MSSGIEGAPFTYILGSPGRHLVLNSLAAIAAQDSRPAQEETPPASPRSSHDATEQRGIAPDHSRPIKQTDGKTMLWAGIGVLAVFWVYEMVTAPLFANWRNSKLREQFMPAEKKTAVGPNWRSSPYPNTGIAQIGPPVRSPIPISAAYTFSF